ncbi:MAG: uroporphyrinogen-III C-methyltransferase [Pseudomonas sp.]
MRGKVWLIGAAGDPELLTLKAVRAMAPQADVVLIDDLVNPGAGALPFSAGDFRRQTRRLPLYTATSLIHRLMLRYARQGRRVARLKGGDPSSSAVAAEEPSWLTARGIDCELVNGITAGLAAATQCGISVTLRGVSRGVTLVTAHTQDDSPLNWRGLAEGGTTLVVYMGVAKLAEIRDGLLNGGMASCTPVAMIENASSPTQREYRSQFRARCWQTPSASP